MNLSEKLKLHSVKLYFQYELKQYENNIKNTQRIMKVKIENVKCTTITYQEV